MLDKFRRQLNSKSNVHGSKQKSSFVVDHFAGAVTYTVGNFLAKNHDSLPKEATDKLSKSDNSLLCDMLAASARHSEQRREKQSKHSPGKTSKNLQQVSVARKFVIQVEDLVLSLDKSTCSFVRCIKPNPLMRRIQAGRPGASSSVLSRKSRGKSITSRKSRGVSRGFRKSRNAKEDPTAGVVTSDERPWFDRRYIATQLRSLSIEKATKILQLGLPTRMAYPDLLELFEGVIRGTVESAFLTHGRSEPSLFVAALFFALSVPRTLYRLGKTQVFLHADAITLLETAILTTNQWRTNNSSSGAKFTTKGEERDFASKFRAFLVRRRWKKAFIAVRFANRMTSIVQVLESQHAAAIVIQRSARRTLWSIRYQKLRTGAIEGQRRWRGRKGREKALKQIEIKTSQLEAQKQKQNQNQNQAKAANLGNNKKGSKQNKARGGAGGPQYKEAKTKAGEPQTPPVAPVATSERALSPVSSHENPAQQRYERVRKKSMAGAHFNAARLEEALAKQSAIQEETEHKIDDSYMDDDDVENRSEDSGTSDDDDTVEERKASDSESGDSSPNLTTVALTLGLKSWRRRYLILNNKDREIHFFMQRQGKPRGPRADTFSINPSGYSPAPSIAASHIGPDSELAGNNLQANRKKGVFAGLLKNSPTPAKYLLEIRGGKLKSDILQEDRNLCISFKSFEEMRLWRDALDLITAQSKRATKKAEDTAFGEQRWCSNTRCADRENNTLYGSTCLSCGTML